MGIFSRAINKPKQSVYDMSDKGARERQVQNDFDFSKTEKGPTTARFRELDNYYNNRHYSGDQLQELAEKKGWNFTPPVLPDPFIQVESQIDPEVPAFQFKGRDDDLDSRRAKEREKVVDFICYNNKLKHLNIDNERALNKLGDAFWKVSFDGSIKGPGFVGDIVIGNPDPANIFNDPSAYDIDDCEWIVYAFRMHRRKARRMFGKVIDEIGADNNHDDTEIYENNTRSIDDDTLQVVEYWYRDDEGDVACSIQVGGVEVRHIPKYWQSTSLSGNQLFPFVKYCKIPSAQSFWDKGEIDAIKDLVDAGDREFMTAILNDMFMANDVIVYEDGALADGQELTNIPGDVWKTKLNKINAVRRLGGVSENSGILNMIQFIHEKIQETNGNYDAGQGKEPIRVTTSSGIAQLNERADARKSIKKADRTNGFERLYELIDWTALEFYNTDRLILIRGKDESEPDDLFTFNSNQHQLADPMTGEPYYPKVDIEITAGEGIKKSRAFTLSATQELAAMNITPQNYKIVQSIINLLDLPEKKEINEYLDSLYAPQQQGQMGGQPDINQILSLLSPEEQQAFMSLPPEEQQAMLDEMAARQGGQMGQQMPQQPMLQQGAY